MEKIRKNDKVIILTGKNKGKHGIVTQRINTNYVIINNINIVKKAIKPNPKTGVIGGFINKFMPIHISNIALFNPIANKADRVVFKNLNGKKIRVYKSSGDIIKVS